MIELLDIRVFSKLSELTSFSAVSRVLDMPKSSVSRSLARLEEHLGVALVIRSNRKLALTETGLSFAESARKILSEVGTRRRKSDRSGSRRAACCESARPLRRASS